MSALPTIDTPLSTERLISIYVLRDPRTSEVRYVGKTPNVYLRLREHIYSSRLSRHAGPPNSWLAELRELGKQPLIEVVAQVPYQHGEEAVKRFMLHFSKVSAQ